MLPKDFPEWFSGFITAQLQEIPTFTEQPTYDIDNLTIAYIKLWSVYEIYIKILYKLFEKRCALKEITVKIEEARLMLDNAHSWISDAKEVSAAYSESIRLGKRINIEHGVKKLSSNFKAIAANKYSTRKSDIVLMKLPTAKDIEKASEEFGLDGKRISHLLHPSNSESRYYKTRNTIAHEGKSDIELSNFIRLRINPMKDVVNLIQEQMNAT